MDETLAQSFDRAIYDMARDQRFAGIEFVAATATRSRRELRLCVVIDRPGGVDIQTCERISAEIGLRLRGFAQPHTLEVSSAGLQRRLQTASDFERFSGRPAKIVTSLTIQGSKTHRGVLGGLRGETIILQTPAGELPLPFATIKAANLEFDPRQDLRAQKKAEKQHA